MKNKYKVEIEFFADDAEQAKKIKELLQVVVTIDSKKLAEASPKLVKNPKKLESGLKWI